MPDPCTLSNVSNRVFSTIIGSTHRSRPCPLPTPKPSSPVLLPGTFLSAVAVLSYPGYFCFFAGVAFLVVVFIFFRVPETKGRTLEADFARPHRSQQE